MRKNSHKERDINQIGVSDLPYSGLYNLKVALLLFEGLGQLSIWLNLGYRQTFKSYIRFQIYK